MRIMLVEDEAMIAMIMQDVVQEMGCEVIGPFPAVQPAMAWLEASDAAPDGAILDVNLGGGQRVYPVADALRALGVPFAFATGYGVIDEARFAGSRVLRKPLDLDQLAKVVAGFGAG